MRYRSSKHISLNPIVIIILLNFLLLITTFINREFIIGTLGLWPIFFLKKPWTIVTSMFLHAGFWHLFGNMLTLFFFGSYLSRLVGDGKFLIVYFGGGILGSILFILLAPPFSVAVGASGAVYAVAGALVMLRPNLRVLLYFIIPMPLWAVITLFFVVFSFIPGVAWQAHLGGLIVGLTAGYFFRRRERYRV